MREAVIVEAVRTPLGRRGGKLKDWHPVDLLADTLRELFARSGADPALVDDNITGCVSQVGEQALNIGRNAWLSAGLPEHVPATTVDRQCGSSQQAAHFGAQGVMAGAYDLVVASGVEHMTRVPMGASFMSGPGFPFTQQLQDRYGGNLVPQGISAELVAAKWGLTREENDAFGYRSQSLARQATKEGRFQREIHPIKIQGESGPEMFEIDEGLRETSPEKLASLKPAFFNEDIGKRFPDIKWVVTAGTSSQITDGAAAMLITTPEKAKDLGLKPRARFHTFALAAADPVLMLSGPIPATQKALERAGLKLGDIDAVEINEAFAAVVLAWAKELGADEKWFEKNVNPNGGAIAIGHPLGASGARLMTTLLHELERRGGRYGLQTMCEGGGMANATIIERLD
ncbi:MAG: acetyl-CoA C-acyltransferase [Acidobacteria bacterium]|nr:acetyl-CoA C-acyltransferase [Acidobacteriota bacterium]